MKVFIVVRTVSSRKNPGKVSGYKATIYARGLTSDLSTTGLCPSEEEALERARNTIVKNGWVET